MIRKQTRTGNHHKKRATLYHEMHTEIMPNEDGAHGDHEEEARVRFPSPGLNFPLDHSEVQSVGLPQSLVLDMRYPG